MNRPKKTDPESNPRPMDPKLSILTTKPDNHVKVFHIIEWLKYGMLALLGGAMLH